MLELGSSKPWQEAMFVMTRTRNMSALPLVEYFTPLVDWLKEQNNGEAHCIYIHLHNFRKL
jgi:peptidyl-dipeptidase A